MKFVRKLLLVVGVLSSVFVVVGFFLPRNWNVSVSVEAPASQKEKVFEAIAFFKKWDDWAIWKEVDDTYVSEFSEVDGVPGSWMKWQGQKTGQGKLTMTQVEPGSFIRYDGAIESAENNAEGEIRIEVSQNDPNKIVIIWEDRGELPAIIGGYFKGMVEKSLSEHFQKSLEKLSQTP